MEVKDGKKGRMHGLVYELHLSIDSEQELSINRRVCSTLYAIIAALNSVHGRLPCYRG